MDRGTQLKWPSVVHADALPANSFDDVVVDLTSTWASAAEESQQLSKSLRLHTIVRFAQTSSLSRMASKPELKLMAKRPSNGRTKTSKEL